MAILKVVAEYAKARTLPPAVFEALLQAHKKISTELVIFNLKGEVLLKKRPSLEENPAEPFPNQWHSLGVTHAPSESTQDAFDRLVRDELGNNVKLSEVFDVGLIDVNDSERGRCLSFVKIVTLSGGEITKKGGVGEFFDPDNLPSPIVVNHRNLIIPAAVKKARELGWGSK